MPPLTQSVASPRFAPRHPGTDVDVANHLPLGPAQREGEYVGRLVVAFVGGIEPPHRVTAEKGDGYQPRAALGLEDGLDNAADQRSRQR